jgi:hypothetical protein
MSLLRVPKRLLLGSSLSLSILNQTRKPRRPFCFNMSSESSQPLTHSLTLPTQLGQPIKIIAAPGVSDSQFRWIKIFNLCLSIVSLLKISKKLKIKFSPLFLVLQDCYWIFIIQAVAKKPGIWKWDISYWVILIKTSTCSGCSFFSFSFFLGCSRK